MKAIKIDVEKRDIYQIELEEGLQPIYDAIGNGCECFSVPLTMFGDGFFCDEEILFRPDDVKGAFNVDGFGQLINNCIIIGSDEEGNDKDCVLEVEDVKKIVRFL